MERGPRAWRRSNSPKPRRDPQPRQGRNLPSRSGPEARAAERAQSLKHRSRKPKSRQEDGSQRKNQPNDQPKDQRKEMTDGSPPPAGTLSRSPPPDLRQVRPSCRRRPPRAGTRANSEATLARY